MQFEMLLYFSRMIVFSFLQLLFLSSLLLKSFALVFGLFVLFCVCFNLNSFGLFLGFDVL